MRVKSKEDERKISWGERGVTLKTAKKSYVVNYILVILLVIFLSVLFPLLDIQFSLQPRTVTEIFGTVVVFGFILFIGFLMEEPFLERMTRKYIITNDEVIKIDGIVRKTRIAIPARSVSDITVHKGIFGRIFDFGDVTVRGFKNEIIIKGVSEPEVMYKIIKNKVTVIGKKKGRIEEIEIEEKLKKRKKGRKGKKNEGLVRLPVIEMPEE